MSRSQLHDRLVSLETTCSEAQQAALEDTPFPCLNDRTLRFATDEELVVMREWLEADLDGNWECLGDRPRMLDALAEREALKAEIESQAPGGIWPSWPWVLPRLNSLSTAQFRDALKVAQAMTAEDSEVWAKDFASAWGDVCGS